MRRKVTGYVLGATAFLACPCHLPFTLPLLIVLLSGTAWGAFISENTYLIYGAATAYFVLGLWGGIRLAGRGGARKADCEACVPLPEGKGG